MSPKNVSTSDDDNLRLRQLGYEPQLARRMGVFGNFAVSFSVISILTGILGQFGFGMTTGGPAVMMWGWIAVGGMVMFVVPDWPRSPAPIRHRARSTTWRTNSAGARLAGTRAG